MIQRGYRESKSRQENCWIIKVEKMENISYNWLWKDEQIQSMIDNGNYIAEGADEIGEREG